MVSKVKGRVHNKCNSLTVHFLNKLWDDPSCSKLGTVRRNLFGYYESNQTCQLLDKQVSDMAEKSLQEWNFDFLNESPKTGRYLWQKVSSCEVPLWYAAVSRPVLKDICRQNSPVSVDAEKGVSCEKLSCSFVERTESSKSKENEIKKNDQPPRKKPRLVQTSMKDYTRVKKRRSSYRLRLKQLQLFSHRLRSHHHHHHHHRRRQESRIVS